MKHYCLRTSASGTSITSKQDLVRLMKPRGLSGSFRAKERRQWSMTMATSRPIGVIDNDACFITIIHRFDRVDLDLII